MKIQVRVSNLLQSGQAYFCAFSVNSVTVCPHEIARFKTTTHGIVRKEAVISDSLSRWWLNSGDSLHVFLDHLRDCFTGNRADYAFLFLAAFK